MTSPAAFDEEPDELVAEMMEAIHGVLSSKYRILGPEVEDFERRWASICGTTCAVGVGNGMDSIEIALRALDIGPGDEVVTTPMTAFATVLAIMRAGAIPVLADIDPTTAIMSLDSVTRCLTNRTKAIVLVHLYGYLTDMQPWLKFTQEHDLHLIEDCAQAHLAARDGRVAGSFGIAGAYSFYPTKNLGAVGDGGAIVSNNLALAERAQSLRNYGQTERYRHDLLGLNSRLDELQAALLSVRLGWLGRFTLRRQAIALRYRSRITNPQVALLDPEPGDSNVCHLFVVTCEQRDDLQQHLRDQGVTALIHYPIPVHFQTPTSGLRQDPQGLEHAERHGRTCLSLPCHPQMTDGQVEQVCEAVNGFDF